MLSRPLEAVPYSITYAARLTDSSGVALTGTYNVRIRFYDAQTAGTQLVSGKQTSGACTGSNFITSPAADSYQVSLTSGAFSKVIYFCQSDFNTLFPNSTTTPWIEVQSAPSTDTSFSSGSVVTYPRQQFTVVPYALKIPVDGSTMTYDTSGNLKVGTVQSYQIEGTLSSSQLPSSLTPTSVSATSGVLGTLQITGGTPGAGKVLTSDANGNATWQDASSSSGADTTLRNLFLPPAPTGLSATAGNAQATLAWTAPSVLSQIPITNYSYQVSSNGGSSWGTAVLTNSTAASATVTGLTNGTAYVFKVAGVNGVGTGSYSSASSSVTPALDPYISNVVLLLHMDGANGATTFTDSSTTPKSISRVGDAQISTAQSKFGGASLKLDGSSGYLTIPADTSLDMGANDFTIEFWAYGQDQSRAYPTYLAGQGGWYGGAWGIRFDNTGYSQRFGFFFNPGDPFFSSSSTYSFNQWRHIALSRQSGTFRLFIDGVQQASGHSSASLNLALGGSLRIGFSTWDGYNGYLNDFIDELRITKGVARYTTSFTPSTVPFPNP